MIAKTDAIKSDKQIVYKPFFQAEAVENDLEIIPMIESKSPKNKLTRKEIEERLAVEREAEKQKAAERSLKVLDYFTVNEEYLENMMKSPLKPDDVRIENCSENIFDEMELKLASEKLFNQVDFNASAESLGFPAVTTVLNISTPDEKRKNLVKWQIDNILRLGFDGFKEFSNDIKNRGSEFHNVTESLLKRKPIDESKIDPRIQQSVESIKKILNTEFKDEMVLIEKKVFHGGLFYKGRIDCMGYYKDSLCIIDWKRSDKPKKTLYDMYGAPTQTSAYIG